MDYVVAEATTYKDFKQRQRLPGSMNLNRPLHGQNLSSK
jgi:hypothetical protein